MLLGLLLAAACASGAPASESISGAELARRIEAGDAPLVLDVRSVREFEAGHVPGARNIPHDELPARVEELAAHRGEAIVVHCQSGRRAEVARAALRDAGFERLVDLEGHWRAWEAAGHPVE